MAYSMASAIPACDLHQKKLSSFRCVSYFCSPPPALPRPRFPRRRRGCSCASRTPPIRPPGRAGSCRCRQFAPHPGARRPVHRRRVRRRHLPAQIYARRRGDLDRRRRPHRTNPRPAVGRGATFVGFPIFNPSPQRRGPRKVVLCGDPDGWGPYGVRARLRFRMDASPGFPDRMTSNGDSRPG